MALDFSTEASLYRELRYHLHHEIELVGYGNADEPVNVAVECVTCGIVLIDADAPSDADEELEF